MSGCELEALYELFAKVGNSSAEMGGKVVSLLKMLLEEMRKFKLQPDSTMLKVSVRSLVIALLVKSAEGLAGSKPQLRKHLLANKAIDIFLDFRSF